MSCVAHAFEALKAAYDASTTLHSHGFAVDAATVLVASGNRQRMLIDWERAKKILLPNGPQNIRDFDRTGTWQFMSIKLLQTPHNVLHTVEDDIESFIYVVIWTVAKHTKTDMSDAQLMKFLDAFDYQQNDANVARLNMLKLVISDLEPVTVPLGQLVARLVRRLLSTILDFKQWCRDDRLSGDKAEAQDAIQVVAPTSNNGNPPSDFGTDAAADTNQNHSRLVYDTARLTMQSHTWMLDTMRSSAASPDWKDDDPAIHRVVVVKPGPMVNTSKKRQSNVGAPDSAKKYRHE